VFHYDPNSIPRVFVVENTSRQRGLSIRRGRSMIQSFSRGRGDASGVSNHVKGDVSMDRPRGWTNVLPESRLGIAMLLLEDWWRMTGPSISPGDLEPELPQSFRKRIYLCVIVSSSSPDLLRSDDERFVTISGLQPSDFSLSYTLTSVFVEIYPCPGRCPFVHLIGEHLSARKALRKKALD
jgi:hypothetical protein